MKNFLIELTDFLLPFEMVLLIMGVLTFVVFLSCILNNILRGRKLNTYLIALLILSILMVGFPSVQQFSYSKKAGFVLKLNRATEKGQDLTEKEARELEVSLKDLSESHRPIPENIRFEMVKAHKNLGQLEKAKEELKEISSNKQDIILTKNVLQGKIEIFEADKTLQSDPTDMEALNKLQSNKNILFEMKPYEYDLLKSHKLKNEVMVNLSNK